MAVFSYEELKQAARKARAEMAEKDRLSRKRIRRKPRDPEKRALLFQRAMDRLKRYPPLMTRQGLILPYFKEQTSKDRRDNEYRKIPTVENPKGKTQGCS